MEQTETPIDEEKEKDNYPENNEDSDILENEEEDLLPPEDEAKQLNSGNIFAIIFIALAIIILIFMFFGKSKKKEAEKKQLEESGSKTEFNIDFKEKHHDKPEVNDKYSDESDNEDVEYEESKENSTDDVLATLPDNLQIDYTTQQTPQPAPIAPVGSTNYSSSSSRPDTRNSKSPRKVEGIKGFDYTSGNSLNNILPSNIPMPQQYGSSYPLPPKEDYIDRQLGLIKDIQAPYANQQSPQQIYQTNKEQFFNNKGQSSSGYYLSKSSLWDGTVISGALVTAINTDNPGIVIARVTENVWSSYDHSLLLIPEGSMLYATYNSSVNYGQDKVQVAWNLLIRPDGYRVELGNMNGVNAQGMSGYKGKVSNHPWETLKALGLVAVYSIIQTEITSQIEDANNKYIENAITDVYAQSSSMGNRILDKALDIKPTIKIKEGTEIKLITNKPLELPPVQIPEVSRKYIRTR